MMYHRPTSDYRDALFATQLLSSLEQSGIVVFPDFRTGWYSDDKIAEKYLLEAVGAPLIPSFVFYSENQALKWGGAIEYPIVFKLRGGAGSANVKLVRNFKQFKNIVHKSFGNGISQFDRIGYFKERLRKYKEGKDDIKGLLAGVYKMFFPPFSQRMRIKAKGYVYFQEFQPNNTFDIRVVIIGDKAFTFIRKCRQNDFRASGSGDVIYGECDKEAIKVAFETSRKLGSQITAYDFVYNATKKPLIVEMTWAFSADAILKCGGYFTEDAMWHEDRNINVCHLMVEQVIQEINNRIEESDNRRIKTIIDG